jgi:thiamine-phosphate pyrophosphorylase
MLELTPAVVRTLQVAKQWARWQRSATILPSHLLQGLLHQEEGRPWQLLTQHGLDPELVRRGLPAGVDETDSEDMAPNETLHHIMARANELARNFGEEGSIASDHMLFALLETDGDLREQLEADGLRFAEFESTIWAAQGPPVKLDEPLCLDDAPDVVATARLLDANANRAREALRVVEDYCRFILNDAYLTSQWKDLRHDLAGVLSALPARWLLQARDTDGDVGTSISTSSEMERGGMADVLHAACKRLQEALRSLEEYGKLVNAELAAGIEGLRYRAYTLERALLLGGTTRARLEAAELCVLVSSELCHESLTATVRDAAAGGAQVIQLREKNVDDRTLLERARELRRVTSEAGVLFIINDRPDIARLVEADGVHLGQGDLPVREARQIVGPDVLIGVSTRNLAQLRQAVTDGASYVGVGPAFRSTTKQIDEVAGLEYVRQATEETSLPAFVIGGISAANVAAVVAAGAQRVAVSAAVCRTDDSKSAAAAILRNLHLAESASELTSERRTLIRR